MPVAWAACIGAAERHGLTRVVTRVAAIDDQIVATWVLARPEFAVMPRFTKVWFCSLARRS